MNRRGQAKERREGLFAATLQRTLQEVLARGLSDPRVRGLITVTEVKVAEDRSDATVRVSVFPADHEALTMHGLRAAAGHLRRQVMDRMSSRDMPRLLFETDPSVRRQAELLRAISLAAADSAAAAESRATADGEPPPANDANDLRGHAPPGEAPPADPPPAGTPEGPDAAATTHG